MCEIYPPSPVRAPGRTPTVLAVSSAPAPIHFRVDRLEFTVEVRTGVTVNTGFGTRPRLTDGFSLVLRGPVTPSTHWLQIMWQELEIVTTAGSIRVPGNSPSHAQTGDGPPFTTDVNHPSWFVDRVTTIFHVDRPWYDFLGAGGRQNATPATPAGHLLLTDRPGPEFPYSAVRGYVTQLRNNGQIAASATARTATYRYHAESIVVHEGHVGRRANLSAVFRQPWCVEETVDLTRPTPSPDAGTRSPYSFAPSVAGHGVLPAVLLRVLQAEFGRG